MSWTFERGLFDDWVSHLTCRQKLSLGVRELWERAYEKEIHPSLKIYYRNARSTRKLLVVAYEREVHAIERLLYKIEGDTIKAELVPYCAKILDKFGEEGWFVRGRDSCGCSGILGRLGTKKVSSYQYNCSYHKGLYGSRHSGRIDGTELSESEVSKCLIRYHYYALDKYVLFEKLKEHPLFGEPLKRREKAKLREEREKLAQVLARDEERKRRIEEYKAKDEKNKKAVLG